MFETSDNEGPEFIVAEPAIPQVDIIVPDTNSVSLDNGPKQSKKYITTRINSAIRAANKIKEKYKKQNKKQIGLLNKHNKASTEWLEKAGYLDTKDQDAIQCIINVPK